MVLVRDVMVMVCIVMVNGTWSEVMWLLFVGSFEHTNASHSHLRAPIILKEFPSKLINSVALKITGWAAVLSFCLDNLSFLGPKAAIQGLGILETLRYNSPNVEYLVLFDRLLQSHKPIFFANASNCFEPAKGCGTPNNLILFSPRHFEIESRIAIFGAVKMLNTAYYVWTTGPILRKRCISLISILKNYDGFWEVTDY